MKKFKEWLISFFDSVMEDVINGEFKAHYYGGFVLLIPFFLLYVYWKRQEVN